MQKKIEEKEQKLRENELERADERIKDLENKTEGNKED